MKNKLLVPLILLLILPQIGFSQVKLGKMYFGTGPEVPLKTNGIIHDSKTRVVLYSKDKLVVTKEIVITILDEEGKDRGVFFVTYDNFSKINDAKLWVYTTQGEILEKKKLSDFADVGLSGYVSFYDDLRMKYYNPLVKKTPYTVHYIYEKTYTDFMSLTSWNPQFASDLYVCQASLEVINQSDISYNTLIKNIPDSILTFNDSGNVKTWKVENIAPITLEKYGPTSEEQMPKIEFDLESFEVDGYAGSFESWSDFGQWSYELNKGRQELPPTTVQYIRNMTDSISDPKEKAKRIYEWMQTETRYISIQLGIGGWQSFSAQHVDEKKYGDCKALSNYTKALLAAANIESYYSLVGAGYHVPPLDTMHVSNEFNHVILCVPFKSDTIWLECTSDQTPFGYLGGFTDDRWALLIKDGGSRLVKTTSYSASQNRLQRKTEIILNEEGGVEAKLYAEFHNIQVKKRLSQFEEPLNKQKENLYESININGFHIEQLSNEFLKAREPIIKESMEFSVIKLATTTSSKMFLPLFYLNHKSKFLKEDTARIHPVVLDESFTHIDSVFYQIPENFQIKSIPENVDISSDFGFYQAQVIQNGQQVIYVRKRVQQKGRFPAEKYHDLMNYENAIKKADKINLILEKM